jgi:hypothetical protein
MNLYEIILFLLQTKPKNKKNNNERRKQNKKKSQIHTQGRPVEVVVRV